MGNMIDQIEALTDAQRLLENYYAYVDRYLAKVGNKIENGKWRVVLQWSKKIGTACTEDDQAILAKMREVNRLA